MLKNYLFNPLCSAPFLYSSPLFLSASALHTSFFFFVSAFSGQRLSLFLLLFFFFFFSSCLTFLFSSRVPCFSAQSNSLFSPKTFFSAQNVFASAQNIFQFSPKPFFQFRTFLLQPKTFFNSAHITVSAPFCFVSAFFLFVGFVFSTPFLFVQRLLFFFLFQRLFLFFLPTSKAKNILFRCFTFLLFE